MRRLRFLSLAWSAPAPITVILGLCCFCIAFSWRNVSADGCKLRPKLQYCCYTLAKFFKIGPVLSLLFRDNDCFITDYMSKWDKFHALGLFIILKYVCLQILSSPVSCIETMVTQSWWLLWSRLLVFVRSNFSRMPWMTGLSHIVSLPECDSGSNRFYGLPCVCTARRWRTVWWLRLSERGHTLCYSFTEMLSKEPVSKYLPAN